MYPIYLSRHNSNLIISNGEKLWHYLTLKELSALLRRITLKNKDFHSFRAKNKLESHKKVCENCNYFF